jgi:hypothetical protein
MMKKLMPLLFVCLTACMSPKKALLKTWKIDDIVFLDSLNRVPEQQKTALEQSLKTDFQFSFLPDSAYQVRTPVETIKGKWWLSGDKKSIHTTTPQGTIESKIHSLKENSLQFESAAGLNQSFLFICSPVTDRK